MLQCYSIWLGPKHIKLRNFLLADNFNAPLGFIKSSDLWEYPPEFTRWAPTSCKLELWGPYKLGFEPHLRHYKFGEWSELWLPGDLGFFRRLQAKYVDDMPKLPGTLHAVRVLGVILGRKWAVSRLTLVICGFFWGDYTTQLCIKGQ